MPPIGAPVRQESEPVEGIERGGTIASPKKVVKKQCLDTTFGQDWRITDWERARGAHSRERNVVVDRSISDLFV